MRAGINLYKDEDVINQLEKQLKSMSLTEASKSPNDVALDKGIAVVGGESRMVHKAKRTTGESKLEQERQEQIRKRDIQIFKQSLKQKKVEAAGEGDDESDWESIDDEELPHVKLSELLDGLTLEVNN